MEIKATTGGLPTGDVLATESITDESVPGTLQSVGEVTVTFASPPTLTADDTYAILISSTADSSGGEHYLVAYDADNDYSEGTGIQADSSGVWSSAGYDISFETVMTSLQ